MFLGNSLVSWSCGEKKKIVTRSTVEVEYRVLALLSVEINRIKSLLFELGFEVSNPPPAYCDNVSAKYLCENPILHHCTKHIDIDCNFV